MNKDIFFVKEASGTKGRDGVFIRVFFKDVIYIEGDSDYVIVYAYIEGIIKSIRIHSTMYSMAELLGDAFMQISKKHIVSIVKIKRIEGWETVFMEGGKCLPVGGTYRKADFQKAVTIFTRTEVNTPSQTVRERRDVLQQ